MYASPVSCVLVVDGSVCVGRDGTAAVDADFDSYWEDEARNPNRNRIRIGRQYQATVPPLLKPGESDGRQLEQLETLKWKPENDLSEQQLDQYLSLAKAVALFARAINNSGSNSQTDGESEHNDDNDNANSDSGEQQTADEQSSVSQEENKSSENSDSLISQASDHLHCALKGLSDFVTSHHPFRHDVGCKVPINSSDKSATAEDNCDSKHFKVNWNSNETDLFAKALNACGKNFSAIKKDFLPWKSVQSIIEYYYLKLNRTKLESNHCDTSCETDVTMSSDSPLVSVAGTSTAASPQSPTFSSPNCKEHVNGVSNSMVECETSTSGDYDVNCVNNNLEIKALKAKPVLPSNDDVSNSVSNLGSLKFYMDGQLVLKLNAKQELTGRKCHWVESQDTPKLSRPVRKGNKKLLIEKSEADSKLGHVHNDKCLHQSTEDGEEGSVDSSDEDSLGSSESNAVASPLSVTARKAKVKVENNCFVPLPSPCGLSTSKDQSSRSNVDSSIVKREPLCSPTRSSSFKHNENDCKRKLKVPPWPPDKKKSSLSATMDTKWSAAEKSVQPPEAHAASRKVNNNMYDNYASSAFPVDLTRKSSASSPNSTKSPSSFSSPSVSTSSEVENLKVSSSPIHPMFQSSLTPNSVFSSLRQAKSVKDLKSVEMCQKVKGSKCELSPDKSNASLNWFSNPLMSYFPIYEQYYQYYCRYGLPQLSNTSAAPVDKAESEAKDDLENKGQAKTVSEPVFDKDEEEKGMLYQLLNKDKSSD